MHEITIYICTNKKLRKLVGNNKFLKTLKCDQVCRGYIITYVIM